MAEVIEDAAHHLLGLALPAEDLDAIHHAAERELDARDRRARVALTLEEELLVATLEFFTIELREDRHTTVGVDGGTCVSEQHIPL